MSAFLSLLLSWPPFISAAVIHSPSSLSSINQPGSTDPFIADIRTHGIPREFKIVPGARGTGLGLPDLRTLALATKVVAGLAKFDFQETITTETWYLQDVTLGTRTTGARLGTRGMPVRFQIWAIYSAMRDLIRVEEGAWRPAVYQIKWNEEVFGTLGLYKTPTRGISGLDDSAINATSETSASLLPNMTDTALSPVPATNVSSLAAPEGDLEIQFLQIEENVPRMNDRGVYLNLLNILMRAAVNSADRPITEEFAIAVTGYNIQAAVTGPDQTSKPLARPPYFTWRLLCRAVQGTSDILISRRYFKNFKVHLLIQNVEIGNIIVEPYNRPQPPRMASQE